MQPKTDMNMTGMNVKMKWKDLRASNDESFFSNDVDDVHGICMLEFPFFSRQQYVDFFFCQSR
jgi:hypothetical protein